MQRLAHAFPIRSWLPRYPRAWLRPDLLAGTTLAAYAVPNAVAYALLAGLPPVAGLAGYLFGGVVYAVFGTSRQLAFGPTSAISLVVATTLSPLAGGEAGHFAALAGATALMVGVISLGAGALRWGGIAHFISRPVLTGYKFGAAVVIALSQLPALLGVPGGGHDTVSRVMHLGRQLDRATPRILAVGVGGLLVLEVGQRLLRRVPVGLLVVMASMGASVALGLGARGVPLVGAVPEGLPHLALPAVDLRELPRLLPLAFACFLLAYLEGMATARTLAAKTGDRIDADQELLALGVANLTLGVGQGYPAGGGLGQSAVNERAGARSPLALVVCSGWMAIILLFLVGAFQHLPRATLAALVVASVTSLIDFRELLRLGRASRAAGAVALVSIAGVLAFGILQGVLVAALLSLALILREEASLGITELGRVDGPDPFVDITRHPGARRVPGARVLRINGPLLYFNAEAVEVQLLDRIAAEAASRWLLLDLSFSTDLDVSVGDVLRRLRSELADRGVALWLVDVHHRARADLSRQNLADLLVDPGKRCTVAEALDALQRRAGVAPPC